MILEWPDEFRRQLDRLKEAAEKGGEREKAAYIYILTALKELRDLDGPLQEESFTFKIVRQCRKHEVWRVSHPYHPGVAVRVIAWFPPQSDSVVVALFSGDKANIGDVFYNSVEMRADVAIQAWKRQKGTK
jgi:hypothetical protein